MAIYDRLRDLELELEGYELERNEREVSSGFTRVTTTVVLHGGGREGRGEDVTYEAAAHDHFPQLDLAGRRTLEEFSQQLPALPDYRRWGVESAALDLALRQAGSSLADAVGLPYRPLRFVVSTRLDIRRWLEVAPALEFKVDPTEEWTRETMEPLAATGRVRVVDLKAYYSGTVVDLPPDPVLYRTVVDVFSDAIIEDAALGDGTREALRGAEDRLSFDAPIHSVGDIEALPLEPRHLNVKPSRFGSVERLLECLDYCRERGIATYGGGQFELGVGRPQIQKLASLFYADAPNDVAPGEYNAAGPVAGLPESPLPAPANEPGF